MLTDTAVLRTINNLVGVMWRVPGCAVIYLIYIKERIPLVKQVPSMCRWLDQRGPA